MPTAGGTVPACPSAAARRDRPKGAPGRSGRVRAGRPFPRVDRPGSTPPERQRAGAKSDAEAEGAELLAAVVGDLVRAPRRHPDPVDPDVVDQAGAGTTGQRLTGLVLDDVGQPAGRRGQRHVQDRHVRLVDVDAVDETQVDDVDTQLGVDDVAHGLLEVLQQRRLVGRQLGGALIAGGLVLGHAAVPPVGAVGWAEDRARADASFNAIQLISAHLMRAGYFETPANATASSSSSSSFSATDGSPLACIRVMKCSPVSNASGTVFPTTRSYIADTDAWLIEQPIPW